MVCDKATSTLPAKQISKMCKNQLHPRLRKLNLLRLSFSQGKSGKNKIRYTILSSLLGSKKEGLKSLFWTYYFDINCDSPLHWQMDKLLWQLKDEVAWKIGFPSIRKRDSSRDTFCLLKWERLYIVLKLHRGKSRYLHCLHWFCSLFSVYFTGPLFVHCTHCNTTSTLHFMGPLHVVNSREYRMQYWFSLWYTIQYFNHH